MADWTDPTARVSVRLEWALSGRDIQWLQKELEERGAPNSTYSSVYRYVKGSVEPPLDWLRTAADVLEVRAPWLAFAQGQPTEGVEEGMKKIGGELAKLGTRMRTLVRGGLGAQEVPINALGAVNDLTLEYLVAVERGREAPGEGLQEVAKAIAAPIRSLRHDPASLDPSKYGHYVITVAEALRYLLADEPGVSSGAHTPTSDPGEKQ